MSDSISTNWASVNKASQSLVDQLVADAKALQ